MIVYELRPAFKNELQNQINILKEKGTESNYIVMELQHKLEDNYEQYSERYGKYCLHCSREIVKEMVEGI